MARRAIIQPVAFWFVVGSGMSAVFGLPASSSNDVPSGSAGEVRTVGASRARLAADATIGFDRIPTSDEVEGVGFFTSWYNPPETAQGWRLGVRYTPAQDEQPFEYWALISGDEWHGNVFDITRVPMWSIDIHEGFYPFFSERAR